jgi:hypothetical protein
LSKTLSTPNRPADEALKFSLNFNAKADESLATMARFTIPLN